MIDKKEKIFNSALKLVSEHGFHSAPVSKIAEKAGVAAGTIYVHFKNKEDMIYKLLFHIIDNFFEILFKELDKTKSVKKKFNIIWVKTIDHLLKNHDVSKFMQQFFDSPFHTEKVEKQMRDKMKPLFVFFNEAKKKNIIKDIPNEIIIAFTLDVANILVQKKTKSRIKLSKKSLENSFSVVWDGLKK